MAEKNLENDGGAEADLSCVSSEGTMLHPRHCPFSAEEIDAVKDIASIKRMSYWVGGVFSIAIVALTATVIDTRQEVATRGPRLAALERAAADTSVDFALQSRMNATQDANIAGLKDQLKSIELKLDRLIERYNGNGK